MGKNIKAGILVVVFLLALPLPTSLPEAAKLQEDVFSIPYDTLDYREDVFDCSNMAAFVCDFLDAEKKNAVIIRGRTEDNEDGHAWVEVEEYLIETVTKEVIFNNSRKNDYDLQYPHQYKYNDSNEVRAYLSVECGWDRADAEKEYGYAQYIAQKKLN